MNLEQIKKLDLKKYRQEFGVFLVEGEHLILELQAALATLPQLAQAQQPRLAQVRRLHSQLRQGNCLRNHQDMGRAPEYYPFPQNHLLADKSTLPD